MQILEFECDPWRDEWCVELAGPMGIFIPTDDTDAYNLYPEHRWISNRLRIAQSQGLECGPHDVEPPRYPVFCRSVTRLGHGEPGGRVLHGIREYRSQCVSGNFWMTCLTGDEISTDFAVVRGESAWCRHTVGVADDAGLFDYWVVEDRSRPRLERYCQEWIAQNLPGYTGMVNIARMGGRLLEVRLRFADQWPDLYGRKWLDALVALHRRGTWELVDTERAEGYSVVLRGTKGSSYTYPSSQQLSAYRDIVGISTITSTFPEQRPFDLHAATGGDRLAVINSFNLAVGLRVRAAMARDLRVG